MKLDHIEFGDYSYQEITSREKWMEVLSYLLRIGDFKQYAGKIIFIWTCEGKSPYLRETRQLWKEIIYLQQSEGMQRS